MVVFIENLTFLNVIMTFLTTVIVSECCLELFASLKVILFFEEILGNVEMGSVAVIKGLLILRINAQNLLKLNDRLRVFFGCKELRAMIPV